MASMPPFPPEEEEQGLPPVPPMAPGSARIGASPFNPMRGMEALQGMGQGMGAPGGMPGMGAPSPQFPPEDLPHPGMGASPISGVSTLPMAMPSSPAGITMGDSLEGPLGPSGPSGHIPDPGSIGQPSQSPLDSDPIRSGIMAATSGRLPRPGGY